MPRRSKTPLHADLTRFWLRMLRWLVLTTAEDLKSTLNLPRTDFPMKANLPQAEPRRLEQWKAAGPLPEGARRAEGRAVFVLHDGPPYANGHIHLGTALNKVLKDLVVRSRSMAGHDAPYVPGLGLPRPAHRAAGGQEPGRRRRSEMTPGGLPAGLPRLRREVRRHPARRSSSAWASSASGTTPT